MISNINNLLPIKTFRIETDSWVENYSTDISVFNFVRGHSGQYQAMQDFVDKAQKGDSITIGHKKVTCLSVSDKAIILNISAKKAEIENLENMLPKLRNDQWLMNGKVMSNKFGNNSND